MSKEISKFLSLVLRHAPDTIGIKLDAQGWVRVDELLARAKKAGHKISVEQLLEVVETSDKKRFTLSGEGAFQKIRAAQGHSVAVDLGLAPSRPPAVLFHGTAVASLDRIFSDGLRPGARRQVHLSVDAQTALKVGQRHGRPTVLEVEAERMHEDGLVLTCADNGVWLTDHVPAKYLRFPSEQGMVSAIRE